MKKLFIALMACAAVVSCSKSDIVFDNEQSEIAFSPVAQNTTKSVAGYNGDTFDGVFPTDIDLYVFANAVEGTYSKDNVGSSYFQNAQFEYNSSKGVESQQPTTGTGIATAGAWAGNPTRYWPNVKTLVFAGYSDACGVAKTAKMDFGSKKLTIDSYTQDNTTYTEEGTNDLMWFPCDGTAYDKSANEIAAAMKHACSWITILVKGDNVTAANGSTWKLDKLVVNSLVHTGKVECGATSATWTIASDATKANEDYYAPNTGTAFTTTATKYEKITNNFIVIPQTPTTLDVTYTYTSDATNNLTLTETKNVSLAFDTTRPSSPWLSGYHYIYTITITATEILIDPYVVDWTAYTRNEIAKEVQ